MQAIAIMETDGNLIQTGSPGLVPWWSFTKTVLAIATLRLVEEGLLSLDDELPGGPYTTRQLLRHEAGLPDYGGIAKYHSDVADGKSPWPVDRLLTAIDATRLRYDPGHGWAYSNIGYFMIARLIERLMSRSLAAALASLVFEPAGVDSAYLAVTRSDLAAVQLGNAAGYHPGWVYHGLVVGTACDAARLLWSLLYGGLLQPASLMAMKNGKSLPEHRSDVHPDPAYGLGLMLTADDSDAYPIGHSGAGPGSRIAVYAAGGRAAAVWAAPPSIVDPDISVREILGFPVSPIRST